MEPAKIKFKYIFADNYNPRYANGVLGGINPRGEILMNFFLERQALPNSETHTVEQGKLSEHSVTHEPDDLRTSAVRVIEQGIVMNVEQAKNLHDWLGKVLAEHLKLTAKQ